jgi:gliding motility-associated-like protein
MMPVFFRKVVLISRRLGLLLLLVSDGALVAQIDTEFWFVAPNLTEAHGDAPVIMRFTAFEKPANVIISQPANRAWQPITLQVFAGQSRSIDLTVHLSLLENTPAFTPLNKGLHIQSDQPVTAYYEVNHMFNPDIFALKGRNALGTDFLIPAQNYWSNVDNLSPPAKTAFDIVATHDHTRVTITPAVRVGGHQEGLPFDVILHRGQSYSVEAPSIYRSDQLTGSRVVANQPVAITLKHDSKLNGICWDLGGDQLVPIDVLGNEYIVVKGFLEGGDHVFVMATEDNTRITISGGREMNSSEVALRSGEMYRFNLLAPAAHIKSNAPVYVLHATGFGCEIGLALLPKLECTGSRSVSFNRSTEENFGLILITENGYQDAFGGSIHQSVSADLFDTVPGTGGRYVAAQINLTLPAIANQAFQITNTEGAFHLGIINGGERSGTRYGYFSDFKSLKVLTEASRICQGSQIQLQASGSDRYQWFGSPETDGLTASAIVVSPSGTTTYGVIGSSVTNGCLDTAYLDIEVFEWPKPRMEISPACVNTQVTLLYHGTEPVENLTWIFDRDTFVTGWRDTLHISWSEPGVRNRKLLAENPAGCVVDTVLDLEVGGVLLGLDSTFSLTRGEQVQSETQVLDGKVTGIEIQWSPASGLSCTDCLSPAFSPVTTTDYVLTLTDTLGCISYYYTRIYVDPPVFIPNAFTPNNDGVNDHFEIFSGSLDPEELIILNRWGQIIHRSSGKAVWDGLIEGQSAEPGVYVYHLRARQTESGRLFVTSGSLTLIR